MGGRGAGSGGVALALAGRIPSGFARWILNALPLTCPGCIPANPRAIVRTGASCTRWMRHCCLTSDQKKKEKKKNDITLKTKLGESRWGQVAECPGAANFNGFIFCQKSPPAGTSKPPKSPLRSANGGTMESRLRRHKKSSHFQAVIMGWQLTYPTFKTHLDLSSICPCHPNVLIHTFLWMGLS